VIRSFLNQQEGAMRGATEAIMRGPGSAEAMVERIIAGGPKSGAEALKELRTAFPDSPLSLRVAALTLIRQQQ
jgi:hypothetical protein